MHNSIIVVRKILSYIVEPKFENRPPNQDFYRLDLRAMGYENYEVLKFAKTFVSNFEEMHIAQECRKMSVLMGFVERIEDDPLYYETDIKRIYDTYICKLQKGDVVNSLDVNPIIQLNLLLSHYISVFNKEK